MRKNATEARNLLIQHNVRLVISMAKNYRWSGVELQDLIQEGILGLVRAIDRFEPNRGFKLSTYAHWWIRQVPLPFPLFRYPSAALWPLTRADCSRCGGSRFSRPGLACHGWVLHKMRWKVSRSIFAGGTLCVLWQG